MSTTTNTEFINALFALFEQRVRDIVQNELAASSNLVTDEIRHLVRDEVDACIERHEDKFDHNDFVSEDELKQTVRDELEEADNTDTLRENLLAVFRDAVNALEN